MFRQRLKLGEGGDTGPDNRFLEAIFDRTGVSIMGKRMFEAGEASWPEEPPFHTPVFVVTHEARAPWVREGGTTFHFVNDGIDAALRRAREVSGGKDIRISGGANLVRQYLNAGVVDELVLSVAPTFLAGKRLFDGIDPSAVGLEILDVSASPKVTHLREEEALTEASQAAACTCSQPRPFGVTLTSIGGVRSSSIFVNSSSE